MTSPPDGGAVQGPPAGRRHAPLVGELARFGVMGVVNSTVAIAGTSVLHVGLRVGPLTSNAIATLLATTLSFAGNRWWTFRHRRRSNLVQEYAVFFVLNGVGLLIQLLAIALAVRVLDRDDPVSYHVALLVGVAVASLVRFLSYKKWVFLPRERDVRAGARRPG
ncbi:GtrA family protein [Streptomyces chartreusis]|uniref:GtrA family protein n=1 Tax=Streptomyces chartreusis TaxID=1969 RepID=UPI002E16D5EF